MAKGLDPEQQRRMNEAICSLNATLYHFAAQMLCASMDFAELAAAIDREPRREDEIAECAIARAQMRGIE